MGKKIVNPFLFCECGSIYVVADGCCPDCGRSSDYAVCPGCGRFDCCRAFSATKKLAKEWEVKNNVV
jgi:hypothetical protein